MKIETIKPESCDKCPFFGHSRTIEGTYYDCKYYKKGMLETTKGPKFSFCHVESIIVNETE